MPGVGRWRPPSTGSRARSGSPADEATARLFARQAPGQPVPDDPAARLAALLERLPLPTADLPDLGAQRLETVRATAKRAGIDSARLAEARLVQREDGGSQVEIDVREPDASRPSKFRETLRRLGVPLKGADAAMCGLGPWC